MPLHRRTTPSERSMIRITLFAGFGLVFALWAVSAYDFGRHMWEVQDRTIQIHEWFSATELLLDDVRAGVLEASVDLRDALLDTGANSDDYYRRRVEQSRALVDEALKRYEPYVHSPAEQRDFTELRHKVSDLWEVTGPLLALDERGQTAEALEALLHQIVPRREVIHLMSGHIARLNHSAAEDQRAEVRLAFEALERREWLVGGLALFLSGVVAFVVTRYADRLERQFRQETAKNGEHVEALQRLSERLVRAGEEERRTIARELHDDVGQALTAIKMELARTAPAGAVASPGLDAARRIADGALENVRNLSRMLHPMVLEDLGLVAAVDWYLGEFGKRTGISVDFRHAGLEDRLNASLETCLYRIIQEATTNVARHAHAAGCRVTMQRSFGRVLAIVEDDGCGFECDRLPGAGTPRGLGLVNIRERVTGFAGTMEMSSRVGEGTRLVVELPGSLAVEPPVDAETAA